MKPTKEQVLDWVRSIADVYEDDPISFDMVTLTIDEMQKAYAIAYAAGAADMKDRCAKVCEDVTMGTSVALVGVGFAEAICALGDNDD